MKTYTQEDLDVLEENILEKAFDEDFGNQKAITLEDLQQILTTFFERKIKL
jgi:hypothetical protein